MDMMKGKGADNKFIHTSNSKIFFVNEKVIKRGMILHPFNKQIIYGKDRIVQMYDGLGEDGIFTCLIGPDVDYKGPLRHWSGYFSLFGDLYYDIENAVFGLHVKNMNEIKVERCNEKSFKEVALGTFRDGVNTLYEDDWGVRFWTRWRNSVGNFSGH